LFNERFYYILNSLFILCTELEFTLKNHFPDFESAF